MIEIWMPVVDYERYYEVSNLGRVKSLDRIIYQNDGRKNNIVKKPYRGKILSPYKIKNTGYMEVYISGEKRKVHHLVLESFVGKRPPGYECNHKNYDRSDNRVDNLEWISRSENLIHAHNKTGRKKVHTGQGAGDTHINAKLTNSQVRRIRDIRSNCKIERGYWMKIANSLNVCRGTIYSIWGKNRWNI